MRRIYLALLSLIITASLDAQNVGIGTTAPTNKLHVAGTIRSDTIALGTSAPRAPLTFSPTSGQKISFWDDGTVNGSNYGIGVQGGFLQIHAYGSSDNIVFGYGSSNSFSEVMRIKASGNVGIGTATPGNKLSVNGNADFSGNIGIGTASPSYRLHINNGNNSLRIEGPAATGSGGAAISIGGYGDMQIDKPGVAGGRFIIKENGRIGINNNNPGSTLDITGDLNFTGPLKTNGNAGATGQILSSNGSSSSWINNPVSDMYSLTEEVEATGMLTLSSNPSSQTGDVPGLIKSLTLTKNSKVVVYYTLFVDSPSCAFCGDTTFELWISLNGTNTGRVRKYIKNDNGLTVEGSRILTLGPGTHEIKMSVQNNYGPTIEIAMTPPTIFKSVMSVQVIPQK